MDQQTPPTESLDAAWLDFIDLAPVDDLFVWNLCTEVPDRHDDIQIENFIIRQNAHGTIWGTLRQLSLELRVRHDAWHTVRAEYLLAVAERDAPRSRLAFLGDLFRTPLRRLQLQLDREALLRRIDALVHRLRNVQYEFKFLLAMARKARPLAGDLADPKHRRQLQTEYWANKIQGQLDALVQPNGASAGLYEVLINLPEDVRVKMATCGYEQKTLPSEIEL
jgi:hypothetical protein